VYANKPKAIANYALWATRGDGPALFSEPTPIRCVKGFDGYIVGFLYFGESLASFNTDFQAPKGIFESKFIVQLLSQYLKWCNGSCNDYGRPIGALAMAATAVSDNILVRYGINQSELTNAVD
jgi:hypothetical protein